MRPARIARDAEDADTCGGELGLSVTQEAQLLRSGRRPVEEIEQEQDRAFREELLEPDRFSVVPPGHAPSLIVGSPPRAAAPSPPAGSSPAGGPAVATRWPWDWRRQPGLDQPAQHQPSILGKVPPNWSDTFATASIRGVRWERTNTH